MMDGKALFQSICARNAPHAGFWHGYPNEDSLEALYAYFGVKDDFELGAKLGSCCRWMRPVWFGMWTHPRGLPIFDTFGGRERVFLSQRGVFADCEDLVDIEGFDWPSVRDCTFSGILAEIDRTIAQGQAVLSGLWSGFFHNVSDFFGMEDYFVKMKTDPVLIHAVTERVVRFYERANDQMLTMADGRVDALFIGNDFGSQRDLLISPGDFEEFVLPYLGRLVAVAKRHGIRVAVHSCGSVWRIIPALIAIGVDILHPIQAMADGMDAERLQRDFGGKIVFMGGVDTQRLLPFGTPTQVRAEVRRLKDLFGPNYILSPSHESLLPNVPPENIAAMAEEALR